MTNDTIEGYHRICSFR